MAETPHCVDLRLIDGHVAPPDKQVEDAVAKEQWQKQEALVGIEMRKLTISSTSHSPTAFSYWNRGNLKFIKLNIAALYLLSF